MGAFWDQKKGGGKCNEDGSLAAYLYDTTLTDRKRSATVIFGTPLKAEAYELEMIHDMRGRLAHFKKLDERARSLISGDISVTIPGLLVCA